MTIHFDPTITLSSILHLISLCGFMYVIYRSGMKWLAHAEDTTQKKLNALLRAHNLEPEDYESDKGLLM
jgi:hypothetical protein